MKNYPVIKVVITIITGYITQNFLNLDPLTLFIVLLVLICTALTLSFIKSKIKLLSQNYLIYLSLLCASALFFSITSIGNAAYPFKSPVIRKARLTGEIKEIKLIQSNKLQFVITTDSISADNLIFTRSLDLLVSITDSSDFNRRLFYEIIGVGNRLEISGTIRIGRTNRNPGEFNYQDYLETNGISGLVYCNNIYQVIIRNRGVDFFNNLVFQTRKIIDQKIRTINNKNAAGLIRGLILADRSLIDPDVKTDFVNSGVVHVLAVSGLHVGFITLIFIFLFARLNIYAKSFFILCGLSGFLIITGSPPSVFRAVIMAAVLITANLTGRCKNNFNNLALAALIILLINPEELFNPGFQLSFSAVFSIIIFMPYFQAKIKNISVGNNQIKKLFLFIAVSFSATIGTLPFTLVYFEKLSLVSLFTNIIVIPLIGLIICLAFISLIAAFISPWLSLIFSANNEILVEFLFQIINLFSSLSWSHIAVKSFSIVEIIIYYLTIIAIALAVLKIHKWRKRLVFILFILLNSALFNSITNDSILPDNKLSIVSIDVGQGDSYLLRFPDNTSILIDAGEASVKWDNGEMVIKPLLERLGIGKIDYAFVSHMDADHYAGFISLINSGLIKKIYKPNIDTLLKYDTEFEQLLRNRNIPIEYYKEGNVSIAGSKFYFLTGNLTAEKFAWDTNNKSGIIKFVFGDISILFTGDSGKKVEKYLCSKYTGFLKSDILKISHHGSKTSTSQEFLDLVSPEYALISAGVGNRFNHPAEEILRRLRNSKIKTFRTDILGAVLLVTEGKNVDHIQWR